MPRPRLRPPRVASKSRWTRTPGVSASVLELVSVYCEAVLGRLLRLSSPASR
jgi:hypothetical protein